MARCSSTAGAPVERESDCHVLTQAEVAQAAPVLIAGVLVFTVAELETFAIRRTPLASRVVQA